MYQPNEHRTEFAGIHAINPFVTYDSSNRSVMTASHFSQRLVVKGANEKRVQSGMEQELAKYTFSIKMPHNARIIKTIDRYPSGIEASSIPFNPETIVIYEDTDTQEIGHVSIPTYASFHQYFGFQYALTPAVNKLTPGTFVPKDTVLADSPCVSENGGYMYGVSLNTAYMSHPAVSEDGILISESALKKLRFNLYDTRVVSFGSGSFPLNLYGDNENYKPFPEIGDYIREDGLLAMLRKYDYDVSPVEMSIYDTREPDWMFDKAVYVRGPKGRIVDIKVFHNPNSKNPMLTGIMDSVDKYTKALKTFYQEIIDCERQIRSERKRKFNDGRISLKQDLHRLTVEGHAVVGEKTSDMRQNLNMQYRDAPLDEYRVEFVIEYEMTPGVGNKATCLHGGKGVFCKTIPDAEMPVDSAGNRAELVMDAGSILNRMNVGRPYEHYFGAAARDTTLGVLNRLTQDTSNNVNCVLGAVKCTRSHATKYIKNLVATNPAAVQDAYNYLLGFYEIICPRSFEFFGKEITAEERLEHLADIAVDGIYVYWPIENEPEAVEVVKQLQAGPYRPVYGPITYVGTSGRTVQSKVNIRVAPLYIMLLEKIADDWSAVSSGKSHHFGVLSPVIKAEKYSLPFHNGPVRFMGETEGRLITGYAGPEAAAEMIDRSNNHTARKQIIKNILRADVPTNIPLTVDRKVVPLGGSKPLQHINHVLQSSGLKFAYEPEAQ